MSNVRVKAIRRVAGKRPLPAVKIDSMALLRRQPRLPALIIMRYWMRVGIAAGARAVWIDWGALERMHDEYSASQGRTVPFTEVAGDDGTLYECWRGRFRTNHMSADTFVRLVRRYLDLGIIFDYRNLLVPAPPDPRELGYTPNWSVLATKVPLPLQAKAQ